MEPIQEARGNRENAMVVIVDQKLVGQTHRLSKHTEKEKRREQVQVKR